MFLSLGLTLFGILLAVLAVLAVLASWRFSSEPVRSVCRNLAVNLSHSAYLERNLPFRMRQIKMSDGL